MNSEIDSVRLGRFVKTMTIQPGIYPGLLEGNFIPEDAFTDYKDNKIDRNVLKGLLFLNCNSYEEMKSGVYEQIKELDDSFAVGKPDIGFKAIYEMFKFSDLIPVMNLVEKAMTGNYRRTREPYFAHTVRVVKRCLDFLDENRKVSERGGNVMNFTAETAKAFLLMAILHDFHEDKVMDYDSGKENQIGSFYLEELTVENVNSAKFVIKCLPRPEINEEELNLTILGSQGVHLLRGLRTLKYLGRESADQFRQLDEATDILREIRTVSAEVAIWAYLPFLVKLFDRKDNLDTYLFSPKEKRDHLPVLTVLSDMTDLTQYDYRTPTREEIIEKMSEVKYLYSAEVKLIRTMEKLPFWYRNLRMVNDEYREFLHIFSKKSAKYLKRREFRLSQDEYSDALTEVYDNRDLRIRKLAGDENIIKLLPSYTAILILLGKNPNEIYKENPWSLKGPWVPVPL
ncbi:MAG: hypothetical protein UV73_C0007G0041 [Candidatus Gottesmanbacteria bacterium GW2011_GWA2_43_14]|uniref:Uncharacterized protein n=1 Tax=Candidatus Gottesmanbacteria bacterium GW2011_GWA2_43_14 TaxID=1618443 RepID=A0A0G1GFH7_9BACT|nr:MAG: hypothetical protein UV73_C0007G0041 [Candidatus Gottesmanbacteria bacterium GW2011_GWA2_43_14]